MRCELLALFRYFTGNLRQKTAIATADRLHRPALVGRLLDGASRTRQIADILDGLDEAEVGGGVERPA